MINATLMDTLISRQETKSEQRRPESATPFAQMLEGKGRGIDNRRELTGKPTEDQVKGANRREWAHQRARVGMGDRNRNLEDKSKPELNDTGPEQAELTESPMNIWFGEIPAILDELIALMDKEMLEIPLEVLKDLQDLIQSMEGFQPSTDQMKLVTEQLVKFAGILEELTVSDDPIPKEENMATLLETLKQMIDVSKNLHQREQTETAPAMKDANWETVAQSVKTPSDPGTKTINPAQGQPENPGPEAIELIATDLKDNPGSSDNQPNLKEFISTEKMLVQGTQQKVDETVIPFSLQQIESLLGQSTLVQELDHQKELVQHQVLQQVVDKIQVIHGNNQSFVTMHLMPEHLGKLTIQLATDLQQGMTARIYAETAHAKEMIESNFGQLKDALSGKGVNLTSLEVFVGQDPGSSEKQREFHFQQAQSQRRKAGKQSNVVGIDTQRVTEQIVAAVNPYMKSEGFDQLG